MAMKKSGTTLVAVIYCHQRGILNVPAVFCNSQNFWIQGRRRQKGICDYWLLRAYLSYTNIFAKMVAARLYQGLTLFSWGKLRLWNNSRNFFFLMSTIPALGLLSAFLIRSIIYYCTINLTKTTFASLKKKMFESRKLYQQSLK